MIKNNSNSLRPRSCLRGIIKTKLIKLRHLGIILFSLIITLPNLRLHLYKASKRGSSKDMVSLLLIWTILYLTNNKKIMILNKYFHKHLKMKILTKMLWLISRLKRKSANYKEQEETKEECDEESRK